MCFVIISIIDIHFNYTIDRCILFTARIMSMFPFVLVIYDYVNIWVYLYLCVILSYQTYHNLPISICFALLHACQSCCRKQNGPYFMLVSLKYIDLLFMFCL